MDTTMRQEMNEVVADFNYLNSPEYALLALGAGIGHVAGTAVGATAVGTIAGGMMYGLITAAKLVPSVAAVLPPMMFVPGFCTTFGVIVGTYKFVTRVI